MPLSIGNWSPFRIDALGIVTLLGAEEVNLAAGKLSENRWFIDCLPLLAANLIAADKVTKPIPGFALYNVTDGILATDITGWFSRWLLSQNLSFAVSCIHISSIDESSNINKEQLALSRTLPRALAKTLLSFSIMAPILGLSAWVQDFWGLANAIAMLLSIWVRHIVESQNLAALSKARSSTEEWFHEPVKVFLTLPDGKAVTIYCSRGIVVNCILTTPRPQNPLFYRMTRAIGWTAFAAHVVTLGQSTLFIQILSVVWLAIGTILTVYRVGDNMSVIGSALQIQQEDLPGNDGRDSRSVAYARMNLSYEEKQSMVSWHLFPQTSNKPWWERYNGLEDQLRKSNIKANNEHPEMKVAECKHATTV